MATLNGTATGQTMIANTKDTPETQVCLVTFTLAGTYAQADDAQLQDVGAFISASRRNGKTITLHDAMRGIPASKALNTSSGFDANDFMSLKTVAVSGDDVTFEVTDEDETTELANGAVPAQSRPFSIIVAFTES